MSDLISRKKAIYALADADAKKLWKRLKFFEIQKCLLDLPSEEPERKTGKWIEELDRKYHWHCSECGYVIGLSKMDSRYCLNCGAKMEEVDDE